jgi:hypothetical protein
MDRPGLSVIKVFETLAAPHSSAYLRLTLMVRHNERYCCYQRLPYRHGLRRHSIVAASGHASPLEAGSCRAHGREQ